MVIAYPNRLRRYEIITNKTEIYYEKEFIADDSDCLDPVFMRNNIPIYLGIKRSKIPGRHLQQFAVIPFKDGKSGIPHQDRRTGRRDQGISDISVRREERHSNDSSEHVCKHQIRQVAGKHSGNGRRKPIRMAV